MTQIKMGKNSEPPHGSKSGKSSKRRALSGSPNPKKNSLKEMTKQLARDWDQVT